MIWINHILPPGAKHGSENKRRTAHFVHALPRANLPTGGIHEKIARLVSACTLALGIAGCATVQEAPKYPAQPVKIIIPYPAGNAADLVGRVVRGETTASKRFTGELGIKPQAYAPPA
jgi:hypothetical protein